MTFRTGTGATAAVACALMLASCSGGTHQAGPTPFTSSSSPTPTSTGSASASPTPSRKPAPKPTHAAPAPPKSASPRPKSAPAGFNLSGVRVKPVPFVGGLSSPLFLTSAGDGSGLDYIVQQGGRIVVVDGAGRRRGTFLDISGRISAGGERGLLGLAFHPGFRTNRRFFVYYTDTNGDINISEFHATSTTSAGAGSERIVLHIPHPNYANHNGGSIAFGADGYLYIGVGDGGSGGDPSNHGQSLNTLLGKILRIDVNHGTPYRSPSTNPFVGRSGARPEIWDYGLRNPWRFSFDRSTHGLFIGDVGQNSYEEIDVERAGAGGRNYGWRQMEGFHCYNPPSGCNRTGKTLPITEYSHSFGCAVTGGYVYRGAAYASLRGAYFFGDYCSGRIWAMDAAAALRGTARVRQVLDTSLNISSFGQDQSGELFVCDLGGTVYRLRAA